MTYGSQTYNNEIEQANNRLLYEILQELKKHDKKLYVLIRKLESSNSEYEEEETGTTERRKQAQQILSPIKELA